MRRASVSYGARRLRSVRGFTLIELMMAMMVLTVGVLSLAATSSIVVRQIGGAQEQTVAATVAQSRLERLRGLGCSAPSLIGGSATTRGIKETWTASVTTGPNTAAKIMTLKDSLRYRTPRGWRSQVYQSARVC